MTASTTTWQSARSFSSVVKVTRPCRAGLLLRGQLAPGDRALGGVLEVLAAPGHRLLGELDADDLVAVAGEDLGDPGTHRAESDHADRGDFTSHGRILSRLMPPPP